MTRTDYPTNFNYLTYLNNQLTNYEKDLPWKVDTYLSRPEIPFFHETTTFTIQPNPFIPHI
jgi:hypothetical protein